MDINIRLPCSKHITVKVDKHDTILLLKEKICLTNILFIKEHFHLYLPGQEQPLHDELSISSLPNTPFLQMIPDTLDTSKLTYDAYSCERHNTIPTCDSATVEDLISTFSGNTIVNSTTHNKSIRIYTSSTIQPGTTSINDSPIKPILPPVPKAAMRKKSFHYTYYNECIIL